VVCAALLYHLAAITLANLPGTTALGSGIHRPFAHYLTLFGLHQTWDMFTTIPHFLDMTGVLAVLDDQGQETSEGPLLPGLERYKKDNRIHVTFMRLAFSAEAYPGYPVRYLAGVCRALLQKKGRLPASVGFELRVKELRPLADVQRDHRIAEPKTFRFGPAACGR
jgi:hypothetical protein